MTAESPVMGNAQRIISQIRQAVVGKDSVLLWVLAAITVGGGLLGITGMLLGVPLTATAYRLLRAELNKAEANAGSSEKPCKESETPQNETSGTNE